MRLLSALFLCSNVLNTIAVNGDEADSQSSQRIEIGATVNEFSFTDTRYLPRSLSEFGERKAFVLVFTTLDCPIVRRSLPTLRKLEAEFRSQGVQFLAINVGPMDSLVDVAGQAVNADLAFPVGKDFNGDVVRALGIHAVALGQHQVQHDQRVGAAHRALQPLVAIARHVRHKLRTLKARLQPVGDHIIVFNNQNSHQFEPAYHRISV